MRECCAIRGCSRPATQTVTERSPRGVPNWHRLCGPHAEEWEAAHATTPPATPRRPTAPAGPEPLDTELPYLLLLAGQPGRSWQALADELGLTEGQSRWRRTHLLDASLMARQGGKKDARWFATPRALAWLVALHPTSPASTPGPCSLCSSAARAAVGAVRVCPNCEPALEDALLAVAAERPLPESPRRWLDARGHRPARGRAA